MLLVILYLLVKGNANFAIGSGERCVWLFQAGVELLVVVNFTVRCNNNVLVMAVKWLGA